MMRVIALCFLLVSGQAWAGNLMSAPWRSDMWYALAPIVQWLIVVGAAAVPAMLAAWCLLSKDRREKRLGGLLALLMLASWSQLAHLTGTAWYVRPISDCSGSACGAADGSSYAAAFNGFADITWGGAGVLAGDTLFLCTGNAGSFTQTSANTANSNLAMLRVQNDGSAGLPIVVDGDCSAEGSLAKAVVDGNYTSGNVIRTDARTYLTLKNMDLSGSKDGGVTLYTSASGEVAVAKHITLSNLTVHDIHGGAQPIGINISGTDGSISDSEVYDVGVDGVFFYSGGSWTLDNLDVHDISTLDTNGDCVQLQRNTGNTFIRHLVCDKRTKDAKQCVVASTLNSQVYVMKVSDMTCLMAPGGTLSVGVYAEGQMTVERSFISNPATYGIVGALNNSANLTAIANIVVNPGIGCFDVHKTSAGPTATIEHNTCVLSGATYGVNAAAATATITVKNNTVSGAATYGIYRGASGTVDDHNNIFGPTTPYSDNGTAGAAGAGDLAVDPGFVEAVPSTADGACLNTDSALLNAGTYVGACIIGYASENLGNPSHIGARGRCLGRAPTGSRAAVSSRTAN